MKKENWFKSLNLVDDDFILEAQPNKTIKPRTFKVIIRTLAACACLALVIFSLWQFIPRNNTFQPVPQPPENEYYELIKSLKKITGKKLEVYKGDAFELFEDESEDDWSSQFGDSATLGEGAPTSSLRGEETYIEVTDNQVNGIIEADRIKRSDKYIYYLDETALRIFSIEKENTKEVGSYKLCDSADKLFTNQWEFYLSNDCKTATIITHSYKESSSSLNSRVNLILLDVSDPANIVKKEEFTISGNYMTSRMYNGSILLLTRFYLNPQKIDFDDETTFVPQIDEGNGEHSLPASSIVCPDNVTYAQYTIVTKLDEKTLDLKGSAAYLSYSENVYVSENHAFLTQTFVDKTESLTGETIEKSMTEISCVNYAGNDFEVQGSATIEGTVKDQWSMDEYNNLLRVFATTTTSTIGEKSIVRTTNASLYCIDLSTFKVAASVEKFAPPNEQIQSVRFDKQSAYVCTSIQLSDPVFFFDLSDINNITYKDTGTIEGFSSSLINLGNGYLCGIGRGDRWDDFKVEIYEETDDGVRSVCSYELENTEYSTNYKSYYIDRKNQLIGVGIFDYYNYKLNKDSNENERYLLLQFKENKLVELINTPLAGDMENMRGVCIDGYMYMFGENNFKVQKVFN